MVFFQVDQSIVDYWKDQNLTEADFYCRDCGSLLLNIGELNDVKFVQHAKNGKLLTHPSFKNCKTGKKYIESPHNRWCVVGRKLSNKVFFRKICWKCFFTKLVQTIDVARKARKSSWYAKILSGNYVPPPTWVSPSSYFKLLFDISDDELNEERAKFDTASLKSFIRRKGEKDGKLAFEKYRKRQAYTCSKDYMYETRGWSDEQWKAFNLSRAATQANFISRYGEEVGKIKWKQYCACEAVNGNALSYFEKLYGKEEGQRKYLEVNSKKALTLKNFVEKYGEIEGRFRYENLQNKPFSAISQKLFKEIDTCLGSFAETSRYETKNGELEICDISSTSNECKLYRVDYVLNKKIIEFNGDFWHANPILYEKSDIVRKNPIQTADEIWKNDAKRIQSLEKLGYQVKVVWEHDYRTDPQKIVCECIEFLKPP